MHPAFFHPPNFLAGCHLLAQLLAGPENSWHGMWRQGLTIIGWVAMWRPLEIYLYRWWPVLVLERVYRRLSIMQVEVKQEAGPAAAAPNTNLPV